MGNHEYGGALACKLNDYRVELIDGDRVEA